MGHKKSYIRLNDLIRSFCLHEQQIPAQVTVVGFQGVFGEPLFHGKVVQKSFEQLFFHGIFRTDELLI